MLEDSETDPTHTEPDGPDQEPLETETARVWATLKKDLPARIFFGYFAFVLLPYLVPVLSPGQLDRFGEVFGDLLFWPIVLVSFQAGLGKLDDAVERRFWHYISLSFAGWMLLRWLREFFPGESWSLPMDSLYIVLYLFFFLASALKPHVTSYPRTDFLTALQTFGGLALVFLLFGYFVVIPATLNLVSYETWRPSFALYSVLDALLALRFFALRRAAPTARWRNVYGLLAISWSMWLCLDFWVGLSYLEILTWPRASGSGFDVFWYLSLLTVGLAARIRHVADTGSAEVAKSRQPSSLAVSQLTSPLVLSAFLFPVIHLTLHSFDLLDTNARQSREVLVLASLLLLGGLAILEHVLVRRYQHQAEEALERQRRELLRADKMIALGTLASGVAHEVNNPTHFIMLNLPILRDAWRDVGHILERHFAEDPDFRLANIPYAEMRHEIPQLIDEIYQGADRIRLIVSELQDYSADHDSQAVGPVTVNRAVRSALTLLANPIKRATRRFSVENEKDLPPIRGNVRRLEQVIINLILNACQALTDPEQAVRVTTSFDPRSRQVAVRVEDEGRGIPEERIERMIDPFYTTRRDQGGTGLGLAVAARIVDEHQGSLTFDSEVGQGTVVRLLLPVYVDTEEGEE